LKPSLSKSVVQGY